MKKVQQILQEAECHIDDSVPYVSVVAEQPEALVVSTLWRQNHPKLNSVRRELSFSQDRGQVGATANVLPAVDSVQQIQGNAGPGECKTQ